MSTKITEKVTINAPGADIVFDGIDFTEGGYIYIQAANSVSLRNCRVYNLTDYGNKSAGFLNSVGTSKCKVIVERCFFGDNPMENGRLYNLINLYTILTDGSTFSNNYFTDKCCTHNEISLYNVDEGATINICNNVFEQIDGGVRLGIYGEPTCVFNINDNVAIAGTEYPEWDGIVMVQPALKQTTSFANCTIHMNNNKSYSNQIIFGYSGANDTMLDETTSPKVYLNGKLVDLTILH